MVEELVSFTVLLRPHAETLVDRYSERVEQDKPIDTPADKADITLSL